MAVYTEEQRQLVENWFSKKQTSTMATGLSYKLSVKLKIPVAHIDVIIKDLLREKLLSSVSGLYQGKLDCHIPPMVKDSLRSWQRVLSEFPECALLEPCHTALADWRQIDMKKLPNCLLNLRAALPEAYQLTKYEASALYLLGSTKLLDNLDKKALKNFGIDTDQFQQPTSYVVLAGPDNPEQVLLIENPQSFEACIRADLHEYQVLICTFGYGLQWSQVLEKPDSVVGLTRAGSTNQNLQQLLNHPNIFFWGDLDYEGLNIYRSITRRLPRCQLSNLYLLMAAELHNGRNHPYTKAVEKERQYHRDDLPCLVGAVDQERFNDKDTLVNFSSGGMTLSEFTSRLPG